MNTDKIRQDFPVLKRGITYFDNACTTLRPNQVIAKLNEYYTEYPACGGRSVHKLSQKVTEEMEKARRTARKFLNARKEQEIVFSKNTTESINLVAKSLDFNRGDIVYTSDKEHNSNLLPWQFLKAKGVTHKILKTKADNTFDMDSFERILKTEKVKLFALGHCSNLDGVSIPARDIIKKAHKHGALVLLDGAQSAPHTEIDVKNLDVDFFAFSGHKVFGPSGTGVLYGKKELLERLRPFIVGGDTVKDSWYDRHVLEDLPERFEAGLQDFGGIIALGTALEYAMKLGTNNIGKHIEKLNRLATEQLQDSVSIIGPKEAKYRSGIFSFTAPMDNHEIALLLDQHNILVRSGAHCVHSWFNSRNMKGSVRASLYAYNTEQEVVEFSKALQQILRLK